MSRVLVGNTRETFEEEGRRFNHIAAMYDESTGFAHYWQNVRKDLICDTLRRLRRDCSSLLDIGCAEGLYLTVGRQLGYVAYGLDLAASKLARSTQKTVALADAQTLPIASQSVDIAMLNRMIEYVPDDAQAIAEAARVARRYLIVTVPKGGPEDRLEYPWGTVGRTYRVEDLHGMLRPYGSIKTLRSVATLGFLPRVGSRIRDWGFYQLRGLKLLDDWISRSHWSTAYCNELLAVVALRD